MDIFKDAVEDSAAKIVEPRTFCRTVRRVTLAGEVKSLRDGAEGKPSLNRAFSQSE